MARPTIAPLDESDGRLLEQVHPPGWRNPPGGSYDLVVVGGGTAGLVSAMGAAGLGARVALVERASLGGDCLNVGCVPSKALLRSARAVREVRAAARVGVSASPAPDFDAIMRRMREVRAGIAHNDSARRLTAAGVDVYFGDARFADRRSVQVGGRALRFRRAVIATGGRPSAPPIPGLSGVPFLTNESVFDLTTLPPRLLVIGAGPIGCELAQAFALFGSAVTVADVAARPLPGEDPDASAIVRRRLESDGVRFDLGVTLTGIAAVVSGLAATASRAGASVSLEIDAVLVAAGRVPNVDGLGLDAAGVRASARGIEVNARLQTTNPRVYAAGDVAVPWKFTHAADATARIVLQNALFFGRRRVTDLIVPWCTYTSPEVAHVGMTYEQAAASGAASVTIPFDELDRAILDDEVDGFVRIHHEAGRIRGATIVGPHAGDLIGHAAHVLRSRGSLGDLAAGIFPYPTYAEALRKAGDADPRTLITPRVRRLFERYFAVARRF